MKVAEIIDAALSAPHGNRQGLSYGQLTVIWLTYILTQYDHRMNPVERWARERQCTLQQATGWQLDDKERQLNNLLILPLLLFVLLV